jgi:hypothetical protein
MKHEALKELEAIIKLPDSNEFRKERNREEQLQIWTERWVVGIEFSQPVTNTKMLTSEHNDLIKIKLAETAAEDLAEECMTYKVQSKRISGAMTAFRRKAK